MTPSISIKRAEVDDHRHEICGEQTDWYRYTAPAEVDRQLLINLMAVFDRVLYLDPWRARVINAIDALNFGSIPQLFRPREKRGRHTYEIRQLELRALEFLAFRRGQGFQRRAAIGSIAEAFGVAQETIFSWQKRLRADLGRLTVSRCETMAKNRGANLEAAKLALYAAKNEDERTEKMRKVEFYWSQYSDVVLHETGNRYRQLLNETSNSGA